MLEKAIEAKVYKYAEEKGFSQNKLSSPACRSVPDRIFFADKQRCFFIEFKATGKKATPAQLRDHERRERQGHIVFVVDNVEDGKRVIDEMVEFFKC